MIFRLLLCALCLTAVQVRADSAIIAVDPGINIEKTRQQVLIGWDGKTQVMVSTANIRASEETVAVEIMPLPAKPEIGEGRTGALFDSMVALNSRLAQLKAAGYNFKDSEVKDIQEAMDLDFEDTIIPENVSCIQSDNWEELEDLVIRRLGDAGMAEPTIPENYRKSLQAALRSGARWWLFNRVLVPKGKSTRGAIHIRFPSKQLYFPLQVNRYDEGKPLIKLIVFANLVENTHGIPRSSIELMHRPVHLHPVNLLDIDKDIYQLFKDDDYTFLRVWHINQPYKKLENDLWVD